MKFFLEFVILSIALLLQITVLPYFAILEIIPDIVLVGVIMIAFREGGVFAMIAAGAIGLMRDMLTTNFLGASMLCLILAAFLAGTFAKVRFRFSVQAQILSVFAIIFVYYGIYYFLYFLNRDISFVAMLFRFALPSALYSLLLAGMAHFILPGGLWGNNS